MYKTLSLCLFLLLSISTLHSQIGIRPGFIITNEGDTIQGYIKDEDAVNNCRQCKFTTELAQPIEEFLPGEIQGYRFNNAEYYITDELEINGEQTKVFVEYLVAGAADLYLYRDAFGKHFYIRKDDGSLVELTDSGSDQLFYSNEPKKSSYKHVGLLRAYFADAEEMFPQIDESKINQKSLVDLTIQYHDITCPDDVCLVYTKSLVKPSFSIAPLVGYRFTSFKNEDNLNKDETVVYDMESFVFGLSTELGLRGISSNTALLFNIGGGYNTGSNTYEVIESPKYEVYTYDYETYFLETDFIFSQAFLYNRFRPFIGLGPSFHMDIVNHNRGLLERHRTDGSIEYYDLDYFPYPPFFIGGKLVAGLKIIPGNRSYLMLSGWVSDSQGFEKQLENFMRNKGVNITWYF